MKSIRLFKPSVGSDELVEIKKTFDDSWIGYGQKVKKFEDQWKDKFNTKYAIAVNSCTAALHASLAINNFKKGKKVLVPAITFSATAACVLYCGLEPIFVDINKYDLNLNFEDLKNKYTKDCVAIIPVHFGGHPCEMEKIIPWAKKKKLIVIEDCAETCGGEYKKKKLGTWGDFGCFSFEEKKIMTTGDGGMICTNNENFAKLLRSFTFHGWDKDPFLRHKKSSYNFSKKFKHWDYDVKILGYKYNMNDLMASIGLAQLKKINWLNSSRTKLIRLYIKEFKNLKNIKITLPYNLNKSSYWMFTIRCKKRDKLIEFLKKNGVSTSVHLKPLPFLKIYKKFKNKISNANKIWKELITLPLFPDMTFSQVKYISNLVQKFDKKIEKI
jgi:perosamine synthetase